MRLYVHIESSQKYLGNGFLRFDTPLFHIGRSFFIHLFTFQVLGALFFLMKSILYN